MNKDYARIYLTKYEREVTELFYDQLINHRSRTSCISTAQAKLLIVTKRLSLSSEETKLIWDRTYNSYLELLRAVSYIRTPEKRTVKFMEHLPDLQVTSLLNQIEARKKDRLLKKVLVTSTPFYLCSTHSNPACGHKNYQGKIYINQNWRVKVQDEAVRARIQAYIRNHKIRNLEWVLGEPVWLLTRPNCKHYIIPVSIEEVLHSSAKSLIKKYQMDKEPSTLKLNVAKYKEKSRKAMVRHLARMYPDRATLPDVLQPKRKKRA